MYICLYNSVYIYIYVHINKCLQNLKNLEMLAQRGGHTVSFSASSPERKRERERERSARGREG